MITAMAHRLSTPDGGFSVDPRRGTEIRAGYAVAAHPRRSRVLAGAVSDRDLCRFIEEARADLRLPGRVLGGWHDPQTGRIHLDVSIVLSTLDDALAAARATGQLAVYDLARRRSCRSGLLAEVARVGGG